MTFASFYNGVSSQSKPPTQFTGSAPNVSIKCTGLASLLSSTESTTTRNVQDRRQMCSSNVQNQRQYCRVQNQRQRGMYRIGAKCVHRMYRISVIIVVYRIKDNAECTGSAPLLMTMYETNANPRV